MIDYCRALAKDCGTSMRRRTASQALALALMVVASVLGGVIAVEEMGTSETAHADIPVLEGDAGGVSSEASGTRKIVFGEKVALDELGPIIVNEDCTMRRITNWQTMSARERRGVTQRVVERNKGRLERCREVHAGKEELRRL